MRPYNGSLFLLKGTYNSVFGDLENEHRGKDTKFYKINKFWFYDLLLIDTLKVKTLFVPPDGTE